MFKADYVFRSLARKPRFAGGIGIVAFAMSLAFLLGLIAALYPPSFVAKLVVFVFGAAVLVYAFAATRTQDIVDAGRGGRWVFNLWAFLLGACPAYLPFKFGPLPGLNPLRIALAAMLLAWAYGLVTSPRLRASLAGGVSNAKLVFGLMTAFLVWQIFSSVIGDEPVFSLYYTAKVLLPAYLIYLVALTFYRGWDDMQRTAASLALGVAVACVVGIVEWKTGVNQFLRFFPDDPEQLAGLEWIIADKSRGGDYRISSTFTHPLVLAEFLCMALPLVVMLAVTASKRWHRALAWSLLPLLLATVYLARTRSSLIASTVALILIALLFGVRSARQRGRRGLALFGWFVMVVAIGSAAFLSGSVGYLAKGRSVPEAGSSDARVLMLDRGLRALEHQPVQGFGAGLAAHKIGVLPGQRSLTIDSYFLSVALESGYLGLALFASAMAAVLVLSVSAGVHAAATPSWVLIALAVGILASLIVKIVLSLTNNLELLSLFVGMSVVGIGLVKKDPATPTLHRIAWRQTTGPAASARPGV